MPPGTAPDRHTGSTRNGNRSLPAEPARAVRRRRDFARIQHPHVPNGLRTVDGSYNNLVPERRPGAPPASRCRASSSRTTSTTADGDEMQLGPSLPHRSSPTTITPHCPASVADADPRTISNLVVDMTINNPAAILAALTFAAPKTRWPTSRSSWRANVTPGDAPAGGKPPRQTSPQGRLPSTAGSRLPMTRTFRTAIIAVREKAAAVTAAETTFGEAEQSLWNAGRH